MRILTFFIILASILLTFYGCGNDQESGLQPEDVIHTVDGYELKYKHVMAYIDMEMEGEDPAQLNDQNYMQELTAECIEEFIEEPELFIADMDVHYEALMSGTGNLGQQIQQNGQLNNGGNLQENAGSQNSNSSGGQWKQLLSGSVLYYTVTESNGGLFVQTTQYMHLCPNGIALLYQNSGGGGGAITAPSQLEFTGSSGWEVVEQGGQAFFRISLQGVSQNLLMQQIGQKIQIQALGTFDIQPGGAQCN